MLRTCRVRLFTYNGESRDLAGWARITGMKYITLYQRIENGWDFERAITTPVATRSRHER